MRRKQSEITKHRLGDEILELRLLGFTYKQISEEIQARYNIHLSLMQISRYLNKEDKKLIDGDKTNTNEIISKIQSQSIRESKHIRDVLEKRFEDLRRTLDLSNLNPTERSHLKKDIIEYEKEFRILITGLENKSQVLIQAIRQNSKDMMNFIIGVSNHLCPDCRERLSKAVIEKEKALQI
jgi:hypothetical protein